MLRVAITHDVDRVKKVTQYFTHSIKSIIKCDYSKLFYTISTIQKYSKVFWNFETIMEIEKEFNVKSTFYFLNERFNFYDNKSWKHALGRYNIESHKIINVIKNLLNNGWEIGLHGSYLSYNNFEKLNKEKQILEKIVGKSIIGTRQHYLNLEINKTWEIQNKIGLKYDSSWGFTKTYGFKENRISPFKPLPDNNEFIVFPMTIMDSAFVNTPSNWLQFEKICEIIDLQNAVLVINWHNCVFDKDEYPGYSDTFIRIIELCKKNDAIFDTLENFYYYYINMI